MLKWKWNDAGTSSLVYRRKCNSISVWMCVCVFRNRFAILIIELTSQIMLIESTDGWIEPDFCIVTKIPENVQCNWIIYICYLKWAAHTNSKWLLFLCPLWFCVRNFFLSLSYVSKSEFSSDSWVEAVFSVYSTEHQWKLSKWASAHSASKWISKS